MDLFAKTFITLGGSASPNFTFASVFFNKKKLPQTLAAATYITSLYGIYSADRPTQRL